MNKHKPTMAPLLILGGLLLTSGLLNAATRSWVNPVDGDFSDASKWGTTPAVPGVNDLAAFNSSTTGESFTVTLTGNITNENMYIASVNDTNLTVNFNLNGFDYATTLTTLNGALSVARGTNAVATLNVYGGGSFSHARADVGYTAGRNGTLTVSGAGTSFSTGTGAVAHAGTGLVTISNGASMTSTGLYEIGRGAGSNGTLVLSGANTTWTAADITVGWFNTASVGSLTVEDGAALTSSALLRIGDLSELVIDGGSIAAGAFETRTTASMAYTLYDPLDNLLSITNNVNLSVDTQLTLALDGDATVNFGDVFNLINYGGTLTGTFAGYTEGQTITLGSYDFQLSYGTGSNSAITLTAIPEPGYFAVAAGLIVLLAVALRRRMR